MSDIQLLTGSVVLPDKTITNGAVVIEGELIAWVGSQADLPDRYADASRLGADGYILPGLIDVHCHGGGGASFPDSLTVADVE